VDEKPRSAFKPFSLLQPFRRVARPGSGANGQRLAARGGKGAKRKAVVAVARKLAVLLHHLWATGEVYQPLRNHPAPVLEAIA
jgi:hypothetical protein